jgi:hypothetical protein
MCVAAVAGGAAGIVAVVGSAGPSSPQISGGSPAADALLESEVRKLPKGEITEASLGGPSEADRVAGLPDQGNNWLWISASAGDDSEAVPVELDASYLVADFARKAADAGIVDLTGATVVVKGPDGQRLDEAGWTIPKGADAPSVTVDSNLDAAMAAIRDRLARGADAAGASLREAKFRTGLTRLTVEATVSVPSAALFMANSRVLLSTILGSDSGYDGRVLRIVDAAGKPILVAAQNFLLRSGATWVAPEHWTAYRSQGTF